ncbi:MAG: sulfatase-like hydrolase/transferase [Verrucomicrobiales bacterium]|nr:sulfatase-like hydrolase/transferase [Verrucomicrobiales bacterium]
MIRPLFAILAFALTVPVFHAADRPNIVLIMADDMGWGQTGYYNHPRLKTPHLDAMAANGLRFDRFYAGASNCSPTRASLLTGRSNDRTGVQNHGFPLRLQEKTLAEAFQDAGYATGHFGKWHLNGLRGPGVPILKDDTHNPGAFGFDTWLSVTNFFDLHPILSRQGEFEDFRGDSSEIVVEEALKFIRAKAKANEPSLTVIWYGTPHSPFMAETKDSEEFSDLDPQSRDHYAELVAMDRSIGAMRAGLRKLGIEKNTIFWFHSDNGGLPKITPETVGGLRGFKNTLYEGGLRVPGIVEWPGTIEPRKTDIPACTMDIFPTLVVAVGLDSEKAMPHDIDGISLVPLFEGKMTERPKPIPFRHDNRGALIDGKFKVLSQNLQQGEFKLFDLEADKTETTDISDQHPEVKKRMVEAYHAWNETVKASVTGADYESGKVDPQPPRIFWTEVEAYRPYFEEWAKRPEYAGRLKPILNPKQGKKRKKPAK